MREQRGRALRILLLWLLLEVIGAGQVLQPDGATVLQSWLRWLASPAVWTARQVGDLSEELRIGIRSSRSLLEEYRELRIENQRIAAERALLAEDIKVLREANELIASLPRLSEKGILGRCNYRDLAGGRMRMRFEAPGGLPRGCAAVSGPGLVGRVVSQTRRECWVQMITHPGTAVAVESESGTVQGLVVGSGRQFLKVEYVPRNAIILRGEVLLSSGADGVFPAGIPVARVQSVRESDAAFLDVDARPCVDLAAVRVALFLPDWTIGPHQP